MLSSASNTFNDTESLVRGTVAPKLLCLCLQVNRNSTPLARLANRLGTCPIGRLTAGEMLPARGASQNAEAQCEPANGEWQMAENSRAQWKFANKKGDQRWSPCLDCRKPRLSLKRNQSAQPLLLFLLARRGGVLVARTGRAGIGTRRGRIALVAGGLVDLRRGRGALALIRRPGR